MQIQDDSEIRLPSKYPQRSSEPEPAPKSLAIAIGLNVLWPGAGYWYYGRRGLGIMLMIVLPIIMIFLFQMIFVFWVIMIIDLIILDYKNKGQVALATTHKCPFCAEQIKREAKVCRYCGRDV